MAATIIIFKKVINNCFIYCIYVVRVNFWLRFMYEEKFETAAS